MTDVARVVKDFLLVLVSSKPTQGSGGGAPQVFTVYFE